MIAINKEFINSKNITKNKEFKKEVIYTRDELVEHFRDRIKGEAIAYLDAVLNGNEKAEKIYYDNIYDVGVDATNLLIKI